MFTEHNIKVIIGIFAILIIAMCLANAHEWYPNECCNDRDCREVPMKDLKPAEGGCWEYVPKHIKFCGKEVRASPDGMYHACFNSNNVGYCVFIPPGT